MILPPACLVVDVVGLCIEGFRDLGERGRTSTMRAVTPVTGLLAISPSDALVYLMSLLLVLCQEDLQKEVTDEKTNAKSYAVAVLAYPSFLILWDSHLNFAFYGAPQELAAAKSAEIKALEEKVVAKTQECRQSSPCARCHTHTLHTLNSATFRPEAVFKYVRLRKSQTS